MKQSFLTALLSLGLLVWLPCCEWDGQQAGKPGPAQADIPVQPGGLDRSGAHLQYTRHARCRMDCRQISQAEVRDILQHGTFNPRKSDPVDKPCPSYALEGYTLEDHQHVRIIFAQCDRQTKVVTCIDLDHDFSCNCR